MKPKGIDLANMANEEAESYYAEHPSSPAAVRRPQLFVRGDLWIALLGPNAEKGIVGIGRTVTDALQSFDAQCLAGFRPPKRSSKRSQATRRRSASNSKSPGNLAC